jgi:O-antigen/teichoic acid export membrane protein
MTLTQRITSATAQLTLSNALVRLLSLVTMPVLTHLLAPSAFGTAAMAMTVMSLISVVGLAGMDMSYVRGYRSSLNLSSQGVELFAWRYTLAAGILLCIGVVVSWHVVAATFSLPGYLGELLGVGIILNLTNTMAQARARLNNRYRAMSISIVISGLGSAAISLGVAHWWRQDELPLVLAIVAGLLISLPVLGSPPISQLRKPSGLSPKDRRNVFMIGLAGIVTAPVYWIISSSDRWFLGYFENTASVGIYTIGYNVAVIGMMANKAVLSVWTPETVKEFERNPDQAPILLGMTAERLVAGFACVWLAIAAAGGDLIRLLAAPAFHHATVVVPFIAAGVMFHGIIHLANAVFLLMKRLENTIWFWIAGGALSMLLNIVLIPKFGILGAAISQVGSYLLIAVGMVIGAQRMYPLKLNWSRLGGVLVGSCFMAILMFPAWASTPVASLLLKLPIGVVTTMIVLKCVAPEILHVRLWGKQESN